MKRTTDMLDDYDDEEEEEKESGELLQYQYKMATEVAVQWTWHLSLEREIASVILRSLKKKKLHEELQKKKDDVEKELKEQLEKRKKNWSN
ncbi:hypothetical protein RFI_34805 [Reticulomyxa filosa]|uniref:Uncharacterized protein n=1 Tax=Reticulomyxa filosa TaxID=46433 RepID=X6LKY3_RETFI|nr:hypothetical protein RFI_34805 [Reticulomyxa filosa]|eukprot:ETO02613.1 hypothetical protein RFI_34805 [Reticulomyxa filosa]